MATFYTADTHWGHVRILSLCDRPWDSIKEMNEALVRNWNDTVDIDSVVYHLGDVALGQIDDSLKYITRLNGTKYLVPGNHDRIWSGNRKRKDIDFYRYTDVGFIILPEQTTCVNGWRLSHLPYHGDSHHDDRYKEMRPVPAYPNEWLLTGHVHQHWAEKGHQINVGVDVRGFKPVHEDRIREIMRETEDNE